MMMGVWKACIWSFNSSLIFSRKTGEKEDEEGSKSKSRGKYISSCNVLQLVPPTITIGKHSPTM